MPRPEVQGRDVDRAFDMLLLVFIGEPEVDEDGPAPLDHGVHLGRGELGNAVRRVAGDRPRVGPAHQVAHSPVEPDPAELDHGLAGACAGVSATSRMSLSGGRTYPVYVEKFMAMSTW